MSIYKPFLFLLCVVVFNTSHAFLNYSDSIKSDSQLLLLDSVTNSYYLKECCDDTLGKCLEVDKPCTIALRYYSFASWMILKENPYKKIITQLGKREESFFGRDTFSFDLSLLPPAGDSAAPITIVAYVSASCPLCKKVCIPLHMAVTDGPIKGMAKLHLKTMTTSIGDMALLAADAQGKFWEFFLSLEKEDRRLNEKILVSRARKIGLNIDKFKYMIYEDKKRERLKKSWEEAQKNGVQISPTLFVNNRRYRSYKDPQWVIDLVEYENENINK